MFRSLGPLVFPKSTGAERPREELARDAGRLASWSISRFPAGDLGMSGLFLRSPRRMEAEAGRRALGSPRSLQLCPFPSGARRGRATGSKCASLLLPPPRGQGS